MEDIKQTNLLNEEYILNKTTDTNYIYFGSRKAILDLMKDEHYRSLKDIEKAIGIIPTTSSALLRSFRTEKYGSHKVETKKNDVGEVLYRMVINHDKS